MKNLIISILMTMIIGIVGCGGGSGGNGNKPDPTATYDANGNWDVEASTNVKELSSDCQYLIEELYGDNIIFDNSIGILRFTFEAEQNGTNFNGYVYYDDEKSDLICGTIKDNEYIANGQYETMIDDLTLNISWNFLITLSKDNYGHGHIYYNIETDDAEFECSELTTSLKCWKEGVRDTNLKIEPAVEYDFGIIEYGKDAKQIFTITNVGNPDYTSSVKFDINLDSSQFRYDTTYTDDYNKVCYMYGCSLYKEERCTFQIIYEPIVWPSNDSTEIVIISDDPNNSETVINLSGTATNKLPILQVEVENECDPYEETWGQLACMCFDDQPQCTESNPKHITISNQGSIDLNLNLIIGNEYSFFIYLPDDTSLFDYYFSGGYPVTLYPSEELSLKVVFRPTNSGKHWNCLEIETNDPNHEREVIRLQGVGIYVPFADCW